MASTAQQKQERIDLRTSEETKALLTRAAAYSGLSLTAFLVQAATDKAKHILAEEEIVLLSADDWCAFSSAFDAIEKPRPRLKEGAKRYMARRAGSRAK